MTRRRRGREIISGRRGKCRPGNARRDDVDPNAVPLCRMRSRPMMHLAITIDRAGSKSYYHETNDRSGNDQIPEAAISRERVRNAFRFTRTHSQHRMYVRVCTTSSRAHIPRTFGSFHLSITDSSDSRSETVPRVFRLARLGSRASSPNHRADFLQRRNFAEGVLSSAREAARHVFDRIHRTARSEESNGRFSRFHTHDVLIILIAGVNPCFTLVCLYLRL